MRDKIKGVAAALAVVAALAVGGAAIAGATGGGSDQQAEQGESDANEAGDGQSFTGSALDKASAAALQETGGGTVTETEAGDEESSYEVEVTRADGSQVDVHLDDQFNVVNAESDGGE
jgi:uncharacterized membrane protein YkoI